jgi:hypothetical protein
MGGDPPCPPPQAIVPADRHSPNGSGNGRAEGITIAGGCDGGGFGSADEEPEGAGFGFPPFPGLVGATAGGAAGGEGTNGGGSSACGGV